MSFNPIFIDSENPLLDRGDDLTRSTQGVELSADDLEHRQQHPSHNQLLLFGKTSPGAVIRRCQQQYYHDFTWQVNFPQVPNSLLLYYPDAYKELTTEPSAIGVMQSELDAMSEGVLQRIPLSYYPLQYETVKEARATAIETYRRVEQIQRRTRESGQLDQLTWKVEYANPMLEEEDTDLLDVDIDRPLVLQRDLPSLTLLQRPLYTDMGHVPQEQRHAARIARIIPEELRGIPQGEGRSGSPMSPLSPQGAGLSAFETAADSEAKHKEWRQDVQRSFRLARTVDQQFDNFVQVLTREKLGLNPSSPSHTNFVCRLWRELFRDTSSAQQRSAWNMLCRFSSSYGEVSHVETVRNLTTSVMELRLPHYVAHWKPLMREYTDLVQEYVATLAGGVAGRKSQLRFSGAELEPFPTGSFQADVTLESMLQRTGCERGENHSLLPIYPVEVIPVYPSGFQCAAESGIDARKSEDGAFDFLAESIDDLHHVVLPGATVGGDANVRGPHVLVNGTNLLVADYRSYVDAVKDGATVGYHTSKENTFAPLLSDTQNTGSYIMRLFHLPDGARERGSASTAQGMTNTDGKYVTYDRIDHRNTFIKASNVEEPPFERYVLFYSNEPETTNKRTRNEHSVDAEALPNLPVKRERCDE